MIRINLFGKLSVTGSGGEQIPLAGAKTQGLLAYLALNTEMPPTRDQIIALFWGDRFSDQARQSLRQAIAKLKRTLADEADDVVLTEHDRVGLNPDRVQVDIDEFGRLVNDTSPEAIKRAVSLLSGPLLDGLYGQQADFDDWIVSERQRFSTLSLKVLERAAEYELMQGKTQSALDYARRIVAIDPLRDAGQMVLIRILAQQGERAAAIQTFNAYQKTLKDELGVEPGPELLKLMQEVRGEGFFANVAAPEHSVAAAPIAAAAVHETGRMSVAVVPFATIASDSQDTFLAAGLTEDVITNLSRFSWLDVKASSEGAGPRLTSAEMSAFGKELGLDYIVHGSLRSQDKHIRLTAQLAEPRNARYVWVTRYDRQADDLFAVQDELSETIAASVEAELERLAGRSTRDVALENMNAWDCYHRGLAIQYEFNADTNLTAQKHFRRAIELDPNFGLAYARLSYAIVISTIYFEAEGVAELLDEALDLARTAARLEPDDAVARFALGRVHLARGEYDRSITNLKAAVELNPGMAQAHCGLGDSMAYSGRLDEAIGCFEEAVRISPSDPYRWAFLAYGATAFLFKGDYEAAAKWAAEAEAVPNAHYWPTAIRASALAHLGQAEQAADAVAELRRLRPGIDSDFVRDRLFYLRDPKHVETYVSGLQKAGLA
ncbi:MAG: tetratricopeptide repeat protein [Hyphomicrobiales bacterium]|nr:tetratricopeptide repeat protein [Hyphomicrobiales bacterium]